MTTKTPKTKARFKDFGSGKPVNKEPITFKLHDEDFEASPALPGVVIIDFVKRSQEADEAGGLSLILDFFKAALLDESYARFAALIEDRDRSVSVETLAEIVEWLLGEYGDRPEEPSEE